MVPLVERMGALQQATAPKSANWTSLKQKAIEAISLREVDESAIRWTPFRSQFYTEIDGVSQPLRSLVTFRNNVPFQENRR